MTDKHLAFNLGKIASDFGSGRKAPRIKTGEYRQGFWFWPTNASHLNWEISPGISVLAGKRLAFKLRNIARNSGPDRKTSRVQTDQ